MDTPQRTNVNTLGEFGLIDHLTQNFPLQQPTTIKGIGDDGAVLAQTGKQTVVSTDLLVEGIHFDLAYSPLKHLGYKAVVVNLSDIYAMNAIPRQITVSIAISNRYSVEALDELYAGIRLACEQYNVDLIGGDTTSNLKGMVISVTAIGDADANQIVYRSGAKVGDLVCLTGNVGGAYLGLQLLEREKQVWKENPDVAPDFDDQKYLLERQLKPEARRDMIENYFVQANLKPTAMIDVSDGVASELFHICKASNVGVFIEESGLPIHQDTKMQALKFNIDPTVCALNGGEDYELLFTVNPDDIEKIKFMPDIYIMGEIVEASEGLTIHTSGGRKHPIEAQGWVHFNPNK